MNVARRLFLSACLVVAASSSEIVVGAEPIGFHLLREATLNLEEWTRELVPHMDVLPDRVTLFISYMGGDPGAPPPPGGVQLVRLEPCPPGYDEPCYVVVPVGETPVAVGAEAPAVQVQRVGNTYDIRLLP